MNSFKPVLQALVLADRIYEDGSSGKKIIAGTFSRLIVVHREQAESDSPEGVPVLVQIPAGGMLAGSPFAFISVTDIHTEAHLTLRYVHLSSVERDVLFQAELVARSNDPLRTVELVVPLPTLPAIPGVFALEVLCNAELLGSHRVVVEEVQG